MKLSTRFAGLLAIALLVAGCSGAGPTPITVYVTPAPTTADYIFPSALNDPGADLTVGSGIITFGTSYDPDTLKILKPTSRFKRTFPEIAWSASFIEPAGATTIKIVIASQSASGTERVLFHGEVDVADPLSDTFANSADLAFVVDNKTGTYVMRYLRDATVLAEGTFTLVK